MISSKNAISLLLSLTISLGFAAWVFADEPPDDTAPVFLQFSAINAGFKDDNSAQNYDFVELSYSGELPLNLASYRLVYTNSSGKIAGELAFVENIQLAESRLLLGFKNSQQFADSLPEYLYYFSSSGLASTAGMLELFYNEQLVDVVCWGKAFCENPQPKFATDVAQNQTLVRCLLDDCEAPYILDNYLPELTPSALQIVELEIAEDLPSCTGVIINELYSYYSANQSEQFVELYNPTTETISLCNCQLRYKKHNYPLTGELEPDGYLIVRSDDLKLTKNPTVPLLLEIIDQNAETVASVEQSNHQKIGTSYAYFTEEDTWYQTYQPTPGAANIFQEFRSCEEGKEINPATGNCIKIATPTIKTCTDGYYLNPATNRCKKNSTDTMVLTECPTGYERNPTTNRCRKIPQSSGSEYAVEPPTEETYQNTQVFIATGAIIVTTIATIIYVILHFRHEIRTAFLRLRFKIRPLRTKV